MARAASGVLWEWPGWSAHTRRRGCATILPDADVDDLVLLDDLLGIGDPTTEPPTSTPMPAGDGSPPCSTLPLLARPAPAVYVIDDAQWIDGVSESMLAEFITAVPQAHALVLITYRPEYCGILTQTPDSTTISLDPLDHSESSALTRELLGSDSSIETLAVRIAERSAGNPFFTEEIVRDLAERGILDGERGAYVCSGDGDVARACRPSRPPSRHASTASAWQPNGRSTPHR